MRLCTLISVLFLISIYVGNIYVCSTPSLPPPPLWDSHGLNEDVRFIETTVSLDITIVYGLILIMWLILLLCHVWLLICNNTHYVPLNTNLNLLRKNRSSSIVPYFSRLWYSAASFLTLVILISECEANRMHILLAITIPHLKFVLYFKLVFSIFYKFKKTISMTFLATSLVLMFSIATTPSAQYVCVCVFQTFCLILAKKSPSWLSILLILISNDIEQNPGPGYHNNFNFMNWNLNSLTTNKFSRIQLIEAHNSLHNYDLISICETSLTDSLLPCVPEVEGYTFEPANHPDNVTHGGVGLFYKNSLPIVVRRDLSFSESIVIELKFGRKKVFFTVLYRSPSSAYGSPEFQDFIEKSSF